MPSATDRAAIDRAIRAAAPTVLADKEMLDRIVAKVSLAMLEEADLMAVLRQAEAEHGRRNAASIAARLIVGPGNPLAVENLAHLLRKRRRKADQGSVVAVAAE